MSYSSGDELEQKAGSRYSLVVAVAKRAKQLREGAAKLVEGKSRNPITVALEEIAAGKVQIVAPSPEQLEAAERVEIPARPQAKTTAELLTVPEQGEEAEPVEAGAVGAEAAEEAPSESPAEPEEAEITAEADDEPAAADEAKEEAEEAPAEEEIPSDSETEEHEE